MSNKTYQIQFQITSYWQAGTGRSGGALVDSLVNKDINGLPFLPGRTIKGLLRQAVSSVEQWGHIPPDSTYHFFGSDPLSEGLTRLETQPGALAVSDAVLPEELIAWLSHEEKKTELCQSFFKQISSTRIDPKTGNAIDKSLRNIEVTIPLNLTATLTVLNEDALNALNWEENQTWIDGLTSCFKLIRAVGASRSRGLGRVKVTGIIEIC